MKRLTIVFLSASLLFVLMLTVSNGSYGTTDNDAPGIENPVYNVDINSQVENAINVEISTIEFMFLSEPFLNEQTSPDTQGIFNINEQDSFTTSFNEVLRLAYYKQNLYFFIIKEPDYG